MINGGIFLYGQMEPAARERVVASLRDAYEVDFRGVRSFYHDGRLIYEYDVRLDYRKLGPAFVSYFNALLTPGEEELDLTAEEMATIFANPHNPETVYIVAIDAWSRQVVEVRHPHNQIIGIYHDAGRSRGV